MDFLKNLIILDSIQKKILAIVLPIVTIAGIFSYVLINDAIGKRSLAAEYREMDEANGHLTIASAHQALQRGIGVTLLSSQSPPAALVSKFNQLTEQTNAEIEEGSEHIVNITEIVHFPDLEKEFADWENPRKALVAAIPRVTARTIDLEEWFKITTAAINSNFELRDVLFAPHEPDERVIAYNTILRPLASEVAEFAGRERALIGSVIARKVPITEEEKQRLRLFRTTVDRAVEKIDAFTHLELTPPSVKQAIDAFETEFLENFEALRQAFSAQSAITTDEVAIMRPEQEEFLGSFDKFLGSRITEMTFLKNTGMMQSLAKGLATNDSNLVATSRKNSENDFAALIETTKAYTQVRFLDNRGKEVVRVDYDGSTVKRITGRSLQNRGDNDYFKEAVKLPEGGVWTSPFNLSKEKGKIEVPHRPVIRFSTPVYYKDRLAGVVVVNVMGDEFFKIVTGHTEEGEIHYLVNQDGYYLLNLADRNRAWGFVPGIDREDYNLKSDFPELAKRMLSGKRGAFATADGTSYIWTPVYFDPADKSRFWVVSDQIAPVNYPVTASEWIAAATKAIDSALHISDIVDEEGNKAGAEVTSGANYEMALAIGLMLLAVILTVVMFLVIRGYILRPINAIINLFSEIGMGDYQARVDIANQDELGTMATALNAMLDNTLSLIQSSDEKDKLQVDLQNLLEDVAVVADGDLTQDARVTAGFTGAIADAVNFMIDSLRGVITQVQSSTLQVSSAANQIQVTAENLAASNNENALQIANASSAIEEMAVSIQSVSDNADTSSAVATEALNASKKGADVVSSSVDAMGRIRDKVQETSKRLKRLGESSQEIDDIVQLIVELTDRTSILALNASIQAAMAGEHGKGFAVVASEVERLAERSTEATKQITRLVATIQSETNETITAMEESTAEVVEGTRLADEAGRTLGEIEGVSIKLEDLLGSISKAAKQQARGSEELARTMSDISGVTQTSAAGTAEAAVSIKHLAELSDELRESVSSFKLAKEG